MILENYPFYDFEDTEDLRNPDKLFYDSSKKYIEPKVDFVISRNSLGEKISSYGDDIWDLTPYSRKTINIHFETILDDELKKESKRILFMYLFKTEGKGSSYVSGESLNGVYLMGVRPIIDFIFPKKFTLKQFFENDKYINDYLKYIEKNCLYICIHFQVILNLLNKLRVEHSGINYKESKNNNQKLAQLIKTYTNNMNQTEVIPVEIYVKAAQMRWQYIEEIEKNIGSIVGFLKEMIENENFAYSTKGCKIDKNGKTKRWIQIENFISWEDAVNKYNLKDFYEKYNVECRHQVQKIIRLIQGTSRHLIHMYTGMRDNECRTLESDCFLEANDELPCRIQGVETKIHGKPTKQVWITHPEIKRVINILNLITEPIYKFYTPYLAKKPLIISPGFLLNQKRNKYYEYQGSIARSLGKHSLSEMELDSEQILVKQSHVEEELMVIDPIRNWTNHKWLKIGKAWNFTSHQYRRSLAVYSLGSGLVSIFALKEQFGHLLSVMTEYYGNGYLKAKNILGIEDKDHIANYIKRNAIYIEAMTFTKEVALSDELLFGGSGNFFDKYLVAKTPEAKNVILKNLSLTIKQVEKGELRWHSTPLGGCVTLDPCDKYLIPTSLFSCIKCEYSVQKISKIEKIITLQEKYINEFDINDLNSITHRTEIKKLSELKNYLNFLKAKAKIN
ncbi:hypothetical protein [Aliarcobacter butzleri]|uniref:hypothetical protein n=1 Tax=Aliarcobacter butzleri TaxID=28197 RepID=UPI001EDB222A|nr:hypothetical protein [Aliarcobacter butzleri]MCG3692490.1 hypothetical protein [Aliarcobacter butzleri]